MSDKNLQMVDDEAEVQGFDSLYGAFVAGVNFGAQQEAFREVAFENTYGHNSKGAQTCLRYENGR